MLIASLSFSITWRGGLFIDDAQQLHLLLVGSTTDAHSIDYIPSRTTPHLPLAIPPYCVFLQLWSSNANFNWYFLKIIILPPTLFLITLGKPGPRKRVLNCQ